MIGKLLTCIKAEVWDGLGVGVGSGEGIVRAGIFNASEVLG